MNDNIKSELQYYTETVSYLHLFSVFCGFFLASFLSCVPKVARPEYVCILCTRYSQASVGLYLVYPMLPGQCLFLSCVLNFARTVSVCIYCSANLFFICTVVQRCCLFALLNRLVYLYCCTDLLFICTVVQTCCFLHCCTNVLSISTDVQGCCLFLLLN